MKEVLGIRSVNAETLTKQQKNTQLGEKKKVTFHWFHCTKWIKVVVWPVNLLLCQSFNCSYSYRRLPQGLCHWLCVNYNKLFFCCFVFSPPHISCNKQKQNKHSLQNTYLPVARPTRSLWKFEVLVQEKLQKSIDSYLKKKKASPPGYPEKKKSLQEYGKIPNCDLKSALALPLVTLSWVSASAGRHRTDTFIFTWRAQQGKRFLQLTLL